MLLSRALARQGFARTAPGWPAQQTHQRPPTKTTTLQSYLDGNHGVSNLHPISTRMAGLFHQDRSDRCGATMIRHVQLFSGHLMITSSYPTVGVSTLAVLFGEWLSAFRPPTNFAFCTSLPFRSMRIVGSGRPTTTTNGKPHRLL